MASFSRRDLLARSVAATAAGVLFDTGFGEVRAADGHPKKKLTPDQFKKRLRGPILSFPTCFTADSKLDFPGMRRLIEMGVEARVHLVTMTAGNNQYDRLSYDEIKALTRFMIETVAGRAMTMAATGPWRTEQAVDYARFANSFGADALQVYLPAAGEEDKQFDHVKAAAAAAKSAIGIQGQPSLSLMKRLLTLDAVVAFKEEFTTLYTLPFYREFGDRLNIFAGGEKARFLTYRPYGMQAYYSTFVTFAPQIAVRFWKSVESGDLKHAHQMVLRYEVPLFQRFSHPFWRATLEHFGVASRWARPPESSYTDKQMQELKPFYQSLGLQPEKR